MGDASHAWTGCTGWRETIEGVKSPEVDRPLAGADAPPTAVFRLVDGGAAARSIGDRQTGAVAIVGAHARAELSRQSANTSAARTRADN